MHKKNGKPKAFPAMMALVRENWPSYLGAMAATVMIVIIGFITPLVLAETIDFVLDTKPSTLPDFAVSAIESLGGRDFLRANLWVMGLALIILIFGLAVQFRTKTTAGIVTISIAVAMTALWIVTDSYFYPFIFGFNHIDGLMSYLVCMLLPCPCFPRSAL